MFDVFDDQQVNPLGILDGSFVKDLRISAMRVDFQYWYYVEDSSPSGWVVFVLSGPMGKAYSATVPCRSLSKSGFILKIWSK
jgi:hypothetical protein